MRNLLNTLAFVWIDILETGKSIGDGFCLHIAKGGAIAMLIETIGTNDIELLTISLRPFYLPREFGKVFITVVKIPPYQMTGKPQN